MVRLIMHGCNGKMGQVITRMVKEDPKWKLLPEWTNIRDFQ